MGWQRIDGAVKVLFAPSSDARYVPDGDVVVGAGYWTVPSLLAYPEHKGVKCYLVQGYEADRELVDASLRLPVHKLVIARWLGALCRDSGGGSPMYVPNAVDHARFHLTDAIERRPRQVAMVFSSVPIKGSVDGIEAVRIARQHFADLRLVCFGTCRREHWVPKWAEYYRNPEQEFMVREIYNKSSVFLAPSLSEGLGLPPIEAACCGCALVATDIPGFREYITDGVNGLLSPPQNPKALAQNLCALLGDEKRRVDLATEANRRALGLRWEPSFDLLEDYLARIRAAGPCGTGS